MANYIIDDTALSAVATAIKSKGKTTASLSWPTGYTSAINDIKVGKCKDNIFTIINVTYPEGSICTATNGIITLTAKDTSGETVFDIPAPSGNSENWTISCTNGEKNDSKVVTIENYGQIEDINLSYAKIYGVSWDGTSTTTWTRTDESTNFLDPVPYVSGASSYGSPFDSLSPWKDMTIVEDSEAGTMVKIPKFWYKLTPNGESDSAGFKIQIADAAIEGFSICPACMDRGDGNGERDYILVGRYHCASTYKSTSGVKPLNKKTRSSFRSSIQNLGIGIYMMDFAADFTIWLLYLIEFADWNCQLKIGYGCGDGSAAGNMGYTDSMPYHTGTTQSSRVTYGLGTQYRYIEGLWDNARDWIDGCYYANDGFYVIKNPENVSDSSGGIKIGQLGTGSSGTDRYPGGFLISNFNNAFPIFIPSSSGGSGSTYSCDAWGFDGSSPCLSAGGHYSNSDYYGFFSIYPYTTSYTSAGIGSRLMKLP